MPAWKSKRVQRKKEKKNKRWERDSKSKSRSRSRRNSVKPHYTRKRVRTSKSDKDEFSKFLKSKARKDGTAWKAKTKRKQVSPKSKSPKKRKYATDWNFNAMMDISDDSLEKYKQNAKPSKVVGLPVWPPKAPSPSKLKSPSHYFKPAEASVSPLNLTEDDYKVLDGAIKDAVDKTFNPSPLVTKSDIKSVKSKKDHKLLTPAQILMGDFRALGKGPKKRKTSKKHKKSKKSKKSRRKTKKKKKN